MNVRDAPPFSWTAAAALTAPFAVIGASGMRPVELWSVSKPVIVLVVSAVMALADVKSTTVEPIGQVKFANGVVEVAVMPVTPVVPRTMLCVAVKVCVWAPDVTTSVSPLLMLPFSVCEGIWSVTLEETVPIVSAVPSVTPMIGTLQRPLTFSDGLPGAPLPYQQ